MATEGFCPSCQRTVYVAPHDEAVCPVCSMLLEVAADQTPEGEKVDQTGGAK